MDQRRDEKQLVEQLSNGDVQAFERLFNRYFRTLHNIAWNRLRSLEAADDLVQDVFSDLWKNRSSLKIHTSFEAYLCQAIKNKVFKFIRHKAVREKEEYIRRIRDEYYERTAYPKTEDVIEYHELDTLIRDQLERFPEKTQAIFYLSRRDHYTHQEIAEKLNCSPKTVEYHIGKVLQNLRLYLKDYIAIMIPLFVSLFV